MTNSSPFLSNLDQLFIFDEEQVNLAPRLIDSDVTFVDADENFDGGTLQLKNVSTFAVISVRNEGVGAGQIGFDGGNITYEGTVIGTAGGGPINSSFYAEFNAAATAISIERLIENLTYENWSDTPAPTSTVSLKITDAAGAVARLPIKIDAVTGTASPVDNVAVSNRSTPVFADLDGDGDLDAIVGQSDGHIRFFENTGTATNGVFSERTGIANQFDGFDVGYMSAPTLVDLDGDGDLDAVIGELDGFINYYENTGNVLSPTYAFRTGAANPFDGIDVGVYSTPAFADLDRDGDLDLIVGEQAGNFNYYQNVGSAQLPAYVLRTGTSDPFDGVDVGEFSSLSFADVDVDGDLDAVTGGLDGKINYLENAGIGLTPAFALLTGASNPFNGADAGQHSAPTFADIDGDSDSDVTVGGADGSHDFYVNAATVQPTNLIRHPGTDNPFIDVIAGPRNSPAFIDFNKDGDFDLVIGSRDGTLQYYENTGSALTFVPTERTGTANPFNGIDVGGYSTPTFADLDGDGDLDIISGELHGSILYFESTGTIQAPNFDQRTGTANPFNGIDVGLESVPRFADLDADGDLDMAVAESDGNLNYFENTGSALAPAYVLRTGSADPFEGFDVDRDANLTFADVDGDGDIDGVVGNSIGKFAYLENTGTASSMQFTEQLGRNNPFGSVDVPAWGAPSLVDLDGDGDLDGVFGQQFTRMNYQENVGAGSFRFGIDVSQHADPSNGADVMNGNEGVNTISTLGGNDILRGHAGNDILIGGSGGDSLDGGADMDFASYSTSTAGLVVNLLTPSRNTRDAVGDSYTGIEGLIGSDFNDKLTGDIADNTLLGLAGNDTLVGGAGNDTTNGGSGDDIHFVDASGDVVVEGRKQGTADRVAATVNYRLGAEVYVELLTTTSIKGKAAINLIGNELTQTVLGNAGANVLGDGGGRGIDTLRGLTGNDTYVVRSIGTRIIEKTGQGSNDRVASSLDFTLASHHDIELLTTSNTGSTVGIDLAGNALKQTIVGNAGVNILRSGTGAPDTMHGLDGNDIYRVFNSGDRIVEDAGRGTDRVITTISYQLAAGVSVELFTTDNSTSTEKINLTGNGLAQTIYGNAGRNVITDGSGSGADVLGGLGGNDTYIVRNSLTTILERAGQGKTDRVAVSVDFALASDDDVERLSTTSSTGIAGIDLTGNDLRQAITGNAGNNRIESKGGSDTVRGLGGNDTFIFSSALGAGNVDEIVDFDVAADQIGLDHTIFAAVGPVSGTLYAKHFKANKAGVARDDNDRIIYDTTSGELFYDADGKGGSAGIKFAELASGLALSSSDFDVF